MVMSGYLSQMQYQFDQITLDVDQRALFKQESQIDCEPKVFDLLLYFCQHPETALSRETLIDAVWQGRVVSYAAVNRAVSQVRKIIESDPSNPVYIETVSKVGYRFTVNPTITISGDCSETDTEPNTDNGTKDFLESGAFFGRAKDNVLTKNEQTLPVKHFVVTILCLLVFAVFL